MTGSEDTERGTPSSEDGETHFKESLSLKVGGKACSKGGKGGETTGFQPATAWRKKRWGGKNWEKGMYCRNPTGRVLIAARKKRGRLSP